MGRSSVPVWTRDGPLWVPAEWGRALTERRRDVPLSSAVRAALDARAFLWVPQKGTLRVQHNVGTVGDVTPGTTVTTGAAEATKGAVAELIASTSFEVYWLEIFAFAYGNAATDSQGAMDLLIGTSTEEVLIANMLMGFCGLFSSTATGPKTWRFPLHLPGGTRIACQAAGKRLSTALTVAIFLYGGNGLPPFRPGGKVTTYGMGTVPFGTTIVPGASAAEGAWTQIVAATDEDHFAFVPSFQPGTDTTLNALTYFADLGISTATEEEIGQSYMFTTGSDERMHGPFPAMPTFQDVPGGTRLVMRVSNSGANDVGNYNGVIHAVS